MFNSKCVPVLEYDFCPLHPDQQTWKVQTPLTMNRGGRSQRDGRLGPRTYDAKAPANYVAGLGRGAAGFTTQMDLGPAQSKDVEVSDVLGSQRLQQGDQGPGGRGLQHAPRGYRAGVGRGATPLSKDAAADGDNRDYTQFNPETGYTQHSLFNTKGNKDDDEADRIYASVDEIMAKRHKRRREEQEQEAKKNNTEKRPKLSEVLAPYKASLSTVTEDEWESIPEVGDHSLKYKVAEESFTPVPASFIEAQRRAVSSGAGGNQASSVVDGATSSLGATPIPGARGNAHRSIDGLATTGAGGYKSTMSGMRSIVGGHKSVDPKGYLTSLASLDAATPDIGNVGDVQKNRRLFRSLRVSVTLQLFGFRLVLLVLLVYVVVCFVCRVSLDKVLVQWWSLQLIQVAFFLFFD